jgi:transcriptional regulator with XRE-family HTH domain
MADEVSRLVGDRLKTIRAERGLTGRDLAEASDLSLNTISLIERGKISPTVSTLQKLAQALGVPLPFLVEDHGAKRVVFQQSGQRRQAKSVGVLLENLGTGLREQTIEPLLLTLEPDADSGPDPIVHAGHEFVFCLAGHLEYQVDGQTYGMEPHDSLLFEAQLPHRWRNVGSEEAKVLLVIHAVQGPEAARHGPR